MSTLPFLLSVADELDNLNSQTYMDDFGLGFHPHRHYYRNPNPSIQLSLPASTDWIEERQRCRSHKFVDDSQIDCDDEGNNDDAESEKYGGNHASNRRVANNSNDQDNIDNTVHMYNLSKKCQKYNHGAMASTSDSNSMQSLPQQQHQIQHQQQQQQQRSSPTSSSDESLQKTSTLSSLASIEFLTCFPVKKNKTPKCTSSRKKS